MVSLTNYRSYVAKKVDVDPERKLQKRNPDNEFERAVVWNSIVYGKDRLTSRIWVASSLLLTPATSKLVTMYMDIGEVLQSELERSWKKHCDVHEDVTTCVAAWQKEVAIKPTMLQLLRLHSARIRTLNLSNIPISVDMLHKIAEQCPQLQYLFLHASSIQKNASAMLQAIARIGQLRNLYLSHSCMPNL